MAAILIDKYRLVKIIADQHVKSLLNSHRIRNRLLRIETLPPTQMGFIVIEQEQILVHDAAP